MRSKRVVIGLMALAGASVMIAAATAASVSRLASPPLVPAQIAKDWVKWNKSACRFEAIPRSERPKQWLAVQGKKAPRGTQIGFATQGESGAFVVAVNTSMQRTAEDVGAGYFKVNLQSPDPTQPIVQTQAVVQRKVSVAISWNPIVATMPAELKLYQDACIPLVRITFVQPGTVTFGPSNENAGKMAGEFLVRYIKKKGWDPRTVTFAGAVVPTVGAAINRRVTGCGKTLTDAFPQIKYDELNMGASPVTGQQVFTDWLTAHPAIGQGKHVVSCVVSDAWALGVINSLNAANRGGDAVVVSHGASADGVKAIKGGTPLKASTFFDVGRYGNWVIPLALDVLAGKPVPIKMHQRLLMVTEANAHKFYR